MTTLPRHWRVTDLLNLYLGVSPPPNYWSTGVHWEEPEEWWPVIHENWPAYNKEITPAIGMGVVAEMFRKWPGAERTSHPARSMDGEK